MTKRIRYKNSIEVYEFDKIFTVSNSFRDEFTKKRNQHCLEMFLEDDKVVYLACYDNDQCK